MAGTIIADTIQATSQQISLNVGNTTILTASSTGLTLIPTTNVNINVTNSTATFGGGNVSRPSVSFTGNTSTGMYMPLANTIAWTTAGTERMRIGSDGKVGIGNSSPDAQNLHVGGSAGGGSINGYTRFAVEAPDYSVTTIKAPAANFSQIIFADPTSSNLGGINFFNSSYSTPNALAFCTGGGSEGMRIDQFRNVLFNCSTLPGSSDAVYAKIIKGSGEDNVMRSHVGVSGSKPHFYFFNTNGLIGNISTSGSATSYNTSSDYRLKNNIAPMTGALEKVALLKPVTYKWKADGSSGQGFIAHELAEVVPGCVTGAKDAVDDDGNPVHQSFDASFLVATLTAAIQELKAIVDAQAVEIAALKAK